MTEEDEEFQRLEREAKMRRMAEEDDDIQVYKKPWVGLTDEEIWSTVSRIGTADSNVNPYQIFNDARRIEAKLKEKNA